MIGVLLKLLTMLSKKGYIAIAARSGCCGRTQENAVLSHGLVLYIYKIGLSALSCYFFIVQLHSGRTDIG